MYIFTKTTGGVLMNDESYRSDSLDTILKGGGGDKRTIQEIIPLGLIFKKPMRKYSKNSIVPISEVINDKKMDKLYKKVRPKK